MRYTLVLTPLMLAMSSFALSSDLQRQDQLVWDFAEFVEKFSAKNWSQLQRFISSDTKVGFGGEMGFEGLLQVFGEDDSCHVAMVRALQMGCKKIGEGEAMRCVSPAHLETDVVYLGPRASFKYSGDSSTWVVESLICGGD